MATAAGAGGRLDREKVCPLLLRAFIKEGSHHRVTEFDLKSKFPADDELKMYTWRDATLRELCDLVKEVKPAARGRSTRLSFGFVYPDKAGQPKMRIVGTVHATRPGRDDNKTLADLKFQTGDYLDVGINI